MPFDKEAELVHRTLVERYLVPAADVVALIRIYSSGIDGTLSVIH